MQTIAELINKGYDTITIKGDTKTLTQLTATRTENTHRHRATREQIALYKLTDQYDQAIKNTAREQAKQDEGKAKNRYTARQLNILIDGGDFGGKLTPFSVVMDIKMGVWC